MSLKTTGLYDRAVLHVKGGREHTRWHGAVDAMALSGPRDQSVNGASWKTGTLRMLSGFLVAQVWHSGIQKCQHSHKGAKWSVLQTSGRHRWPNPSSDTHSGRPNRFIYPAWSLDPWRRALSLLKSKPLTVELQWVLLTPKIILWVKGEVRNTARVPNHQSRTGHPKDTNWPWQGI